MCQLILYMKENEATEVFHEMMTVSHELDSERNKQKMQKTIENHCVLFKVIEQRVWTTLSSLTKKKVGGKNKLILAVMKSLRDSFSVSASDIKIAALL